MPVKKFTSSNGDTYKFTMVGLREYFESRLSMLDHILEERDRRMDIRFDASKEATAIAFAASEKANAKTEQAQDAYNVSHNDLLRRLDKQNEEFMTRREYEVTHQALVDQINQLREFKVAIGSKDTQIIAQQGQKRWSVEMWIVALIGLAGWASFLLEIFVRR